jgi:hypothetical protein
MNKQSIGEMLRKIDARPDELESYQGKWANLSFWKDGTCSMGANRYHSATAAHERGQCLLQEVREGRQFLLVNDDGTNRHCKHLMFFMQIPVKS